MFYWVHVITIRKRNLVILGDYSYYLCIYELIMTKDLADAIMQDIKIFSFIFYPFILIVNINVSSWNEHETIKKQIII